MNFYSLQHVINVEKPVGVPTGFKVQINLGVL